MALLALALFFAEAAVGLLAMIPLSAVDASLMLAGAEVAVSKCLFDAGPDCWPAVGSIAVGCTIEFGRSLARDFLNSRGPWRDHARWRRRSAGLSSPRKGVLHLPAGKAAALRSLTKVNYKPPKPA